MSRGIPGIDECSNPTQFLGMLVPTGKKQPRNCFLACVSLISEPSCANVETHDVLPTVIGVLAPLLPGGLVLAKALTCMVDSASVSNASPHDYSIIAIIMP